MGLTTLFTYLKIILLQYFQFSIFGKINGIQTDPNYVCIHVPASASTFCFFFFLERGVSMALCHTNRFRVLFIRPTNIFFSNFFIKNGSHITIHTFKNYFVTVFSVFSKISGIQTDSNSCYFLVAHY